MFELINKYLFTAQNDDCHSLGHQATVPGTHGYKPCEGTEDARPACYLRVNDFCLILFVVVIIFDDM